MSINRNQKGLSLVELLIVMAIMGIITTAIMTLHLNTQDQATATEEVADLQQNVRVAVSEMASDIRMAGLLVFPDPATDQVLAITNAPTNPTDTSGDCWDGVADNCFELQTASASRRIARIGNSAAYTVSIPAGSSSSAAVAMANDRMARLFSVGDLVRVYEPASLEQQVNVIYEVDAMAGANVTISDYSDDLAAAQIYRGGEALVHVDTASVANPSVFWPYETVAYFRDANNRLWRQVNTNAAEILANDISGLTLHYFLEDGSNAATVTGNANLSRIVSVRVAVDGLVNTPKGDKTRSMTTMAYIRN